MVDLGNYLSYDELRGIASLMEVLDKVDTGDAGFSTMIQAFDSNGEKTGVISNREGYHFFYPTVNFDDDPDGLL